MSLLINDMDMPKNGRVTIELASEETGTNILARITDDTTGKLIEHKGVVVIPTSHGDLIDRNHLLDILDKIILKPDSYGQRCMAMATKEILIHQTPVIKAEEKAPN